MRKENRIDLRNLVDQTSTEREKKLEQAVKMRRPS